MSPKPITPAEAVVLAKQEIIEAILDSMSSAEQDRTITEILRVYNG